jgi:hypothetical protein
MNMTRGDVCARFILSTCDFDAPTQGLLPPGSGSDKREATATNSQTVREQLRQTWN